MKSAMTEVAAELQQHLAVAQLDARVCYMRCTGSLYLPLTPRLCSLIPRSLASLFLPVSRRSDLPTDDDIARSISPLLSVPSHLHFSPLSIFGVTSRSAAIRS